MAIVGHLGCPLALLMILMTNVSSCFSFQQTLPITPHVRTSIGAIYHSGPASDWSSLNLGGLSGLRSSAGHRSDGPRIHGNGRRKAASLSLAKGFFENLESQSGKDYEWIAARPPLSRVMIRDILRRKECYISDWTDGLKDMKKVVPAILFLYFACLAPAISFGTIASQITKNSMGVVEFLLSAGTSGMAYSILCGQPMAFIAPTGLTLAFISGLFRFCSLKGLPFFPIYSWVGLWTSFFFTVLGLAGSSQLIRYCTRFTDEIFNALLSLNFIYEALASLRRNFKQADPMNLTMPFVSLGMALTTFFATMSVTAFESRGRNFLIPLNDVPIKIKLLCSLPAVLLTALFYMDQNISVRVVNNPDNGLKKGAAYNLDMVALGLITGVLSIFGLPWMCGATVQSMNHVRALTETQFNPETEEVEIVSVTETRLTGFVIHALMASSLLLLPVIRLVPIPVVSGVFLFLGRKLMSGNSFLKRCRDSFVEKKRLPLDHPMQKLGRKRMSAFTLVQILCLAGLWSFKQNPSTAIFFPSVIGMLMVVRSAVLPKFFSEEELTELGDATPSKHTDEDEINM
ncbi:unnamed protein product [Cylindrotheca closterium]|uniref:Bicarbonate transporter-like transmembrane domain-containing protein n=1 Tax=Cylindrotheca closterium TaxID=2856 RepID=A0AAD2CZ44_9STRA|nr:unnamed protein product [Cylindrotheca closterium]